MEVIGQIYTKAALRLGIWPLVSIEYQTGWASIFRLDTLEKTELSGHYQDLINP